MYLGWSCISCRQPPPTRAINTKDTKDTKDPETLCVLCVLCVVRLNAFTLIGNRGYLSRPQRLEKRARAFEIELRVARLDAQEETVPARQRKPRHVEHRVVRLRQSVQRQHAEHRGQRGAEDRAFEGHRDERRPAVKRLAADVDWIG